MTPTTTAAPITLRPHFTYYERDPETREVTARCHDCGWSEHAVGGALGALDLQIAHENSTRAPQP
jgi:hypothetical protein